LAAGVYLEAEIICRQVLARRPNDAEAHRLLGLVAYCTGNVGRAEGFLQRAIRLDPRAAFAHDNLSVVCMGLGRVAEAEAASRAALELRPGEPNFWCNLGVSLEAQSRTAEAEAAYRRALELRADHFEAMRNLGRLLQQSERLPEAIEVCRKAVMLNRENAPVQVNLAAALAKQGKLDDAQRCYRQALDIDPDHVDALLGLGKVLLDLGQPKSAEGMFRQVLALVPDEPRVRFDLPRALYDQGRPEEAEDYYRLALQFDSSQAPLWAALAQSLWAQGCIEEARATLREALGLAPQSTAIASQILHCEQYRPGVTAAGLAALHARWEAQFGAPARALAPVWNGSRAADRPLRIGFVAADFLQYPLGRLLAPLMERLDRKECEVVCYSNSYASDALSARIRRAVQGWYEVAGLSDEALAEQIRGAQIDILFDLAGHAPGNRLPVFARKPAPIQISWLGYAGSTGLAAMDYLLADRAHVAVACEPHYVERVLRLPDAYLCYDPPTEAPEPGPPPALAQGFVTFGSFNQLAKISSECVACWGEILRRLPTARLLLKGAGADGPRTQQRLTQAFAAAGVEPARIEFQVPSRYPLFLQPYQQVDLALDPFPYGGSLTTCDALWMGVPVVTMPGKTFAGRHAVSHLTNLGFTETIARDAGQYVELAVEWAGDLDRLAAVRRQLRGQMAASPLCNQERFAANFLRLLRAIWCGWVRDEAVPPPAVIPLGWST
jgi:predicted O-linked N-acetylglucosamine transferase (SPINDLY family)